MSRKIVYLISFIALLFLSAPANAILQHWRAAAKSASPAFFATNIADGIYDIGVLSGDITYEFVIRSNPDETEVSMALIGRRHFGETMAGLKYEQWPDTGTYGATIFGVMDYDFGVATNPGVDTHLAFVSSEDLGTTALYVNGVYKASVPTAITLSGIVGIGCGAQAEDGSDYFDNFDGVIFGVAIYDTALSEDVILSHSEAFFEPWPEGLVYFADPNLKAAVEERLGVTDPTTNDMLMMTYISPIDRGITDLTGIEYATNMTVLELYRNEITDVSPLSGLTNLKYLNLQRNQISDISPLSVLHNLLDLDIEGNLIIDITALSGLNNLTGLRLPSNQIVNVSPLSLLTNLLLLDIAGNNINDISPLANLINLDVLGIGNNQISDVSTLSGMTNLTWLGIQQNNIDDISPLSGLSNLMELYLNVNQISDISPLLGLTNLTALQLQSNPLDWPAYYVDIPLIVANNPNLLPENFLYDHKIAYDPYPPDGAGSMDPNVILSWMPSMTGEMHDVYFGDNFTDVNDGTGGTFLGNQTETSFAVGLPGHPYPDGLIPEATYYWRIDELNAEGAVAKGKVWSFTVAGPFDITVTYQVSANEGDGYASNDQLQNLNGAYLKVGSSSFAQLPYYASGMVFRNLNVPQGAEIISAHLSIRSYNSQLSDVVYGKIQAEATDNAAGFGAFRSIGTLPKTKASVNWDLNEPWSADTRYTSPDIASVIQEVIDRGGWSADNSLAIIYSTRQREGGYRNISSYDRGSDYAPILEITYISR
ncbi:MAG: hypothetical protein A2168_07005 [Planctomycetes bacterium RBG_13_50_24]|nr:MAG: hypothetical protein A2168_07005 [Planctomycetes bacterium RBG_13_50_24]